MSITKAQLKLVRVAMAAALAQVGKEHGFEFKIGNISYGHTEFNTKLTATTNVDEAGNKIDVEKQQFESNAKLIGIAPSLYRTSFIFQNKSYLLVQIKPSATKYPFIGQCPSSGKRYKFPDNIKIGNLNNQPESA